VSRPGGSVVYSETNHYLRSTSATSSSSHSLQRCFLKRLSWQLGWNTVAALLEEGPKGPIAGCNDVGLGGFAIWNGALGGVPVSSCAALLKKHLCFTMKDAPTPLQSAVDYLVTVLGCAASCEDGRLLRRPKKEDRRGRREEGNARGRGSSPLRRGDLLGEALPRRSQGGPVSRPEEAPPASRRWTRPPGGSFWRPTPRNAHRPRCPKGASS